MADSFATCGAQVFVSDVDEAALANCPYPKMRADAGVVAECEAFVDAAANALGGLDVLVNNAGIAGPTALVEMSIRQGWTRRYGSILRVCSTARAAPFRICGGRAAVR